MPGCPRLIRQIETSQACQGLKERCKSRSNSLGLAGSLPRPRTPAEGKSAPICLIKVAPGDF